MTKTVKIEATNGQSIQARLTRLQRDYSRNIADAEKAGVSVDYAYHANCLKQAALNIVQNSIACIQTTDNYFTA